MHILILAPVSPRGIAHLLEPDDSAVAHAIDGDYGPAPTALVAALVGQGARVTVVSHRRGHGELRLSGPGLEYVQVDSRRGARAQVLDQWRQERIAMRAEIRKADPTLVHAHWTYEWALAGIQSRLPLVITVRDAPLTILRYQFDAYRLLRLLLAWRVRLSGRRTLMIAASPYMARAWRRQMLWRRSVPVIPNIVPSDLAGRGRRASIPTIAEVADAGARKNVRGLLRAFSIVRSSRRDAELLVMGSGLGDNGALAKWAAKRGLDAGVRFLGKVDRASLSEHLSTAWIHVHASLEESFGNTLLEAMSMGIPVVAGRDSGATPWVIADAGELTNVRDPRALADSITTLLGDPRRQESLKNAGMERVRTVFSPTQIAKDHLAMYRSLIEEF